jgi:hypothetical protein
MTATLTFTGPKRDNIFGGWARSVRVGEQEFACSVRRGKMVRIPYKPRGQNKGYHWHGSVYRIGAGSGCVWDGRVPGSIGCRGLLVEAGILAVNNLETISDDAA